MSDFSIIQEKLKSIMNSILECEDFDRIINILPVYNNYFQQLVEIVNDNNNVLTQNEKLLVEEILDMNKKMQLYFGEKKDELEKIIAKKGLKKKVLKIYDPYFKGEPYLRDV